MVPLDLLSFLFFVKTINCDLVKHVGIYAASSLADAEVCLLVCSVVSAHCAFLRKILI